MIKAIVTDFGRVLLFSNDNSYSGLLNDLHEKLLKDGDYNFWEYFHLNEDLLNFYKELSDRVDVYIFTTRHIQEYPPVAERLEKIFKGVISAARINVDKTTPEAYTMMAKEIDMQPDEILFVDDTEAKLNAAREAGMSVVFYESTDQAIKDIQNALS